MRAGIHCQAELRPGHYFPFPGHLQFGSWLRVLLDPALNGNVGNLAHINSLLGQHFAEFVGFIKLLPTP